jgi:putative addiction module killer protein
MSISIKQRVAIRYQRINGDIPFDSWLKRLKDNGTKAKIVARVERAERGLFDDYKGLDAEIKELRIDFGPGYRVYFAIHKDEIILLLIGGDKSSQTSDIQKAKDYWNEYKNREVQNEKKSKK